jgi:hypothetical protein
MTHAARQSYRRVWGTLHHLSHTVQCNLLPVTGVWRTVQCTLFCSWVWSTVDYTQFSLGKTIYTRNHMKIITGNLECGFRALQLHRNQACLKLWIINWTSCTHTILESTSSPFTNIFSWPLCFAILLDVPNFVIKYEWILHVVSSRILRSNIVLMSLLTSVRKKFSFSDVGQISWYIARAKSEVQIFVFRILFSSSDHERSHTQGLEQQAVRLVLLWHAIQILQMLIYLKTRDDRFFP